MFLLDTTSFIVPFQVVIISAFLIAITTIIFQKRIILELYKQIKNILFKIPYENYTHFYFFYDYFFI